MTYSNFSSNLVEFVSSAIRMDEQAYCIIEFRVCSECISESTISIGGMNDSVCDIDTLNFVECVNHSEAKVVFLHFYTQKLRLNNPFLS